MPVILCYGDSNTHGTSPMTAPGQSPRHPKGSRWPDAMGAALGPAYEVISEGLPGRTTVHDDPVEGGLRNGRTVLPVALHSHKPLDLLILMLGTNDLKNRFSVTSYEIARSVESLALAARAEAVVDEILIVAPVPVSGEGSLAEVVNGALERQVGLDAHLRDVANRLGCGFVAAGDHVAVSPIDGVHWEAEAHHRFGAVMADAVKAHLG